MKDRVKPGLLGLPRGSGLEVVLAAVTRVVLWFLPPWFEPHGVLLLCCVAWVGGCVLEYGTMQQFLVNARLHGSAQTKDEDVGGARLNVRMPHMLPGTFALLLCQVGGCSQHCCCHPLPGLFVSGTCHFVPLGNATEDPTPWLCPVSRDLSSGLTTEILDISAIV